jgi:hypothetical protein
MTTPLPPAACNSRTAALAGFAHESTQRRHAKCIIGIIFEPGRGEPNLCGLCYFVEAGFPSLVFLL